MGLRSWGPAGVSLGSLVSGAQALLNPHNQQILRMFITVLKNFRNTAAEMVSCSVSSGVWPPSVCLVSGPGSCNEASLSSMSTVTRSVSIDKACVTEAAWERNSAHNVNALQSLQRANWPGAADAESSVPASACTKAQWCRLAGYSERHCLPGTSVEFHKVLRAALRWRGLLGDGVNIVLSGNPLITTGPWSSTETLGRRARATLRRTWGWLRSQPGQCRSIVSNMSSTLGEL